MSLTKGTGPFGERPAGALNFGPHAPEHVLYLESTPRRVRVLLAGEPVADSDDVQLLHPPGRTPTYLFPREHVRTERLEATDRRQSDPGMGPRTYWTVVAGEHRSRDAAYSWEQPPDSAAAIAGLIAFDWDSVNVLEEDEEVFVHPRDPYSGIDVLRSSRRVQVSVGNVVVADSTVRGCCSRAACRCAGTCGATTCARSCSSRATRPPAPPYKGIAHYSSVRTDGRYEKDLVWTYTEPFHDAEAVRGLLCFPQETVGVEVM